jgi:hypothetical protein
MEKVVMVLMVVTVVTVVTTVTVVTLVEVVKLVRVVRGVKVESWVKATSLAMAATTLVVIEAATAVGVSAEKVGWCGHWRHRKGRVEFTLILSPKAVLPRRAVFWSSLPR